MKLPVKGITSWAPNFSIKLTWVGFRNKRSSSLLLLLLLHRRYCGRGESWRCVEAQTTKSSGPAGLLGLAHSDAHRGAVLRLFAAPLLSLGPGLTADEVELCCWRSRQSPERHMRTRPSSRNKKSAVLQMQHVKKKRTRTIEEQEEEEEVVEYTEESTQQTVTNKQSSSGQSYVYIRRGAMHTLCQRLRRLST